LSKFERGGDKKTEKKSVLGEESESMNYKGLYSKPAQKSVFGTRYKLQEKRFAEQSSERDF